MPEWIPEENQKESQTEFVDESWRNCKGNPVKYSQRNLGIKRWINLGRNFQKESRKNSRLISRAFLVEFSKEVIGEIPEEVPGGIPTKKNPGETNTELLINLRGKWNRNSNSGKNLWRRNPQNKKIPEGTLKEILKGTPRGIPKAILDQSWRKILGISEENSEITREWTLDEILRILNEGIPRITPSGIPAETPEEIWTPKAFQAEILGGMLRRSLERITEKISGRISNDFPGWIFQRVPE